MIGRWRRKGRWTPLSSPEFLVPIYGTITNDYPNWKSRSCLWLLPSWHAWLSTSSKVLLIFNCYFFSQISHHISISYMVLVLILYYLDLPLETICQLEGNFRPSYPKLPTHIVSRVIYLNHKTLHYPYPS